MTDIETAGTVRATVHDAGEQAHEIAATGKEEVAKVASEVKAQATKLMSETGSKVRERAGSQVGAAASMLGSMSGELERMASSTTPGSSLASLVRDGATVTRKLSDRLDRDGLDGAMRDARKFARRRPVMFLASAFAVGIAAGRLMRNVDPQAIAPSAGEGRTNGEYGSIGSHEVWRDDNGSNGFTTDAEPPWSAAGFPSTGIEANWDAPRGDTIGGELT